MDGTRSKTVIHDRNQTNKAPINKSGPNRASAATNSTRAGDFHSIEHSCRLRSGRRTNLNCRLGFPHLSPLCRARVVHAKTTCCAA
jgi:hypothetical protein